MEEIKCIFCDLKSDQVVIEENGYKGRKCPKCGLIYISPRPTFDEIVDLYGHDEAHTSTQRHLSQEFLKRLYAKHNLRIVNKFIKNGTILEIGAGIGCFLDEARRVGFEPFGIELNRIQAEFIRSKFHIPCVESPLDNSLFEGKKFDVVYHCDVIGHLFDPFSDFRKMYDVLKGNGILVFETGNLGDVRQKYYKYVKKFQYPDHLFLFGEQNLKDLLDRTGFQFIKIYRYSILPELAFLKGLPTVYRYSMLTQCAVFKVLRWIKSRIEFTGRLMQHQKQENTEVTASVNSETNVSEFDFIQLLKKPYNYFIFVLRYKIGYIMPKKERPQTVIVVARKKI